MPINDKWNEWASKILEAIATINTKQEMLSKEIEFINENLTKTLENKERFIIEKLDKLNTLLNGNGSPEKGIIIRLDRLEQSEQRRTWLLRTTIIASIGAVLSTLAAWFKNM